MKRVRQQELLAHWWELARQQGCDLELCEGGNGSAPLRVLLSLTVGMGQGCLACPAWQK